MVQDNSFTKIEQNRLLHNKIADKYQEIHDEIFNAHEQTRIHKILIKLKKSLGSSAPLALDFGCGSGNLTRLLRREGFMVVSADISNRFIELIQNKYKSDSLVIPLLLQGSPNDLNDYQFDLVCIYSVLHHLPNYLESLREISSRIKDGGFLYIDHEACDTFWQDDPEYLQLQRKVRFKKQLLNWNKLFKLSWYIDKFRMIQNARYQPEGDIHVWKDDHIEWQLIRDLMQKEGFEEVYSQDYLHNRMHYSIDIFNEYSSKTSDMHYSVFRKLITE